MAAEGRAHRVVFSRAMFGIAALLWLIAAFLPSTANGSGATLAGHRFADLMASGVLSVSAPSWLGFVWYAMPIGAALTLMALGVKEQRGTLLRVCAASLATVAAISFAALVSKLEVSRFGSGMWCGVVGSAFAVSASCLEVIGDGR